MSLRLPGLRAARAATRGVRGHRRAPRERAVRSSMIVILVMCGLHASCAATPHFSRRVKAGTGQCPVEFIGVYQDRAELVPGLRSARTIYDLQRLLHEANLPGGCNIRARFKVVSVLSEDVNCLRPGDTLCLIFRSRKDLREPPRLPERLVGRKFRVILHDPFKPRYWGRFSCSECQDPKSVSGVWTVALGADR